MVTNTVLPEQTCIVLSKAKILKRTPYKNLNVLEKKKTQKLYVKNGWSRLQDYKRLFEL